MSRKRGIMKRRLNVSAKALIGIIVFTLFFGFLTCLGGYFMFDRAIEKLYNDRGYVVANIILNDIDCDKIAQYSKTWQEDDYYYEMQEYLLKIQEFSNAAYIYIAVPYEDKTMKYIYDSGSNMGFVDPIAASFDEIWKAYTDGERPASYLTRHSKLYGFLTSSCLPIKDSAGNVVALLFVDTDMNEIYGVLNEYILIMAIITIVLLVIFCVMNWYTLRKSLIAPLMLIRNSVSKFAENNGRLDDTLEHIKTGDEIEDLARDVGNMERDIVTYIDNIQAITAEKERISAELNVATRIQADMLPRIFPAFPDRKDFEIYATMTPAREVGGDFYDFFLVDEDHIAMVMADVSGKGVPAALFMVIAKTLIKNRTLMGGKLSTSEILYDVNNQLCEGNDSELFVTVWFAILQLSTGKGVATNAGHEHPFIKRADGKYEAVVYKHSPAVAVMPDMKFEEHEIELGPDDSLFVYTDGIPEATDAENRCYGTDRLMEALNKKPDIQSQELLSEVQKDIDEFVGDAPQFDDITMLVFKYLRKN
jgi:sigma-B regulation protein RsbU (phosphoserine phosphatase)